MDSTEIELGSLNRNVEGLSSKIDDLGKNLSPDEKNSIINGLHESDKTLQDVYNLLNDSLSTDMKELVSMLEKNGSTLIDELKEIRKSLGGKGKGEKSNEKIEKAQKKGKMETFINQIDRKYLAGAIVLHSDLEIVNKNLESIIKKLTGNSSAKTPKEKIETKINKPSKKDDKDKVSFNNMGAALQDIANSLATFGEKAGNVILGLTILNLTLKTLDKSKAKLTTLNKTAKNLDKLSDGFEAIAKTARIAAKSFLIFNLGKIGIKAAEKFVENLSTFNESMSNLKVDKKAVESAENLEAIISALANASIKVTLATPFFITGMIGNVAATGFAASGRLLSFMMSYKTDTNQSLKNAENLSEIISELSGAAIVASLMSPIFITGIIGVLSATGFAFSGRLLSLALSKNIDFKPALENAENLSETIQALSVAAIMSTISLPFFIAGAIGNAAGWVFLFSFRAIQKGTAALNNLEEIEKSCYKIAQIAVELTTAATMMSLGAVLFLAGSLGAVTALLFIESFSLIDFSLEGIRHNIGSMLITTLGMALVSAALIGVVAILSKIADYNLMGILKGLGIVSLITTSMAALGSILYIFSPFISWVGIGAVYILIAAGSLYLALKTLEKCAEIDLEGLSKVVENVKNVIWQFTLILPYLLLGVLTGTLLGIFGITFAIGCGTLLLGIMALNKIGEYDNEIIIAGIQNITFITRELGKSIGWITLATVASILLMGFGVTFTIGVGALWLSTKMLMSIGKMDSNSIIAGFDNIKRVIGNEGLNSFKLIEIGKAEAKALLLAGVAGTLLLTSLSFLGTFKLMSKISKFKETDINTAFTNIKTIFAKVKGIDYAPKEIKQFKKGAKELNTIFKAFNTISENIKNISNNLASVDLDKFNGQLSKINSIFTEKKETRIKIDKDFNKAAKDIDKIIENYSKVFQNISAISKVKPVVISESITSIVSITSALSGIDLDINSIKDFNKSSKEVVKTANILDDIVRPLIKVSSLKFDKTIIESQVGNIMGIINKIIEQIGDAGKDEVKHAKNFEKVTKQVSGITDFLGNITSNLTGIKDYKVDSAIITAATNVINDISALAAIVSARIETPLKTLKKDMTPEYQNFFEGLNENKALKDTVFKKLAKDSENFVSSVKTINETLGALNEIKVTESIDLSGITNVLKEIDGVSAIGAQISMTKLSKSEASLGFISVFGKTAKSAIESWREITVSSIKDIIQEPLGAIKKLLEGINIETPKNNKDIDKALKFIEKFAKDIKGIFKVWDGITAENINALQAPIQSIVNVVETINKMPTINENILNNSMKKAMKDISDSLKDFSKIDYSKLADDSVKRAAENVGLLVSSLSEAKSANVNGLEKMMKSFNILSDKNISKNLDKLSDVNDKIQGKWGDTVINQVTFDAVVNSLTLLSSIIKDKAMNVRVINEMAGEEENKPFQIKKLGGN